MSNRAMYVALGLEPGAPSDEIKRAYRNLSIKLHPDSSRNPGTAARFAKVVRAYKALSVLPDSITGTSVVSKASDRPAIDRRPAQGSSAASALAVRPLADRPLAEPQGNDLFTLGSILTGEASTREKASAARLLGLSGKRSVWIFLRKGLYDPDPEVVGSCVRAAGVLGLAQGAAEIAGAYERSGPEVKDAILEAARATEDPVFKASLQAALSDEDPRRRAIARRITIGA
jgi:hypothetical protein